MYDMYDDFKYKDETLCKELARCIVQTPWGPMIQHHLIMIPNSSKPNSKNAENGHANEMFRKKKAMYDKYMLNKDFELIAWVVVERPWRISWLQSHKELIIQQSGLTVYYKVLRNVFSDTEHAYHYKNEIHELLYYGGNPLMMMNEDELKDYHELPNVLKVMRGVKSVNDIKNISLIGYSWTLDFEKAKWFAERGHLKEEAYPLIFKLVINKEAVLSYLTRRNESEIILDFTKINTEKVEFMYLKDGDTNYTKGVDVK